MKLYDSYEEVRNIAKRDLRGRHMNSVSRSRINMVKKLFEDAYKTSLDQEPDMKGYNFIGRDPLSNKYYYVGVMYNDPGNGKIFDDAYLVYNPSNLKDLTFCIAFDGNYLYNIPGEELRNVVESTKWKIYLRDYTKYRVQLTK